MNNMLFNENAFPAVAATHLLVLVASWFVLAQQNGVFDPPVMDVGALMEGADAIRRMERRRKREESLADESNEAPTKRSRIEHDCERALMCVCQDCLGPDPLFGRQFERIFRVTRTMFDRVWQVVANADPFFACVVNPVTKKAICPEIKVMMALKTLAFGVAPMAFSDCFQMGETAGRSCVKKFCFATAHDKELREKHLRKPTKADCKAISKLHEDEFGHPGNMGCLDCMHVYWRTCPAAWQGQFKNGKEEHSSLVLEAVADYNTWFWHSFFGTPGTNNDINTWDQSPLLRSMLDGTHEGLDFDFTAGKESFSKLWHMVDGIYPEISRFVKTVLVPLNKFQSSCAAWQEGSRKMIERAFGILQRKFQFLCRPVEIFYREDIADVVDTCLILHNMMVEARMEREEPEHLSICDSVALSEDQDRNAVIFREERGQGARRSTTSLTTDNASRLSTGSDMDRQNGVDGRWNLSGDMRAEWELKCAESERRWDELCSEVEHHRLKCALVEMVSKDKAAARNNKQSRSKQNHSDK